MSPAVAERRPTREDCDGPVTSAPFFTPYETARFWAKVDTHDECWLWTTSTRNGYGHFTIGSSNRTFHIDAHRYAYLQLVGPIPPGLCVCHRCDVRRCVRPDHLFLGTIAENLNDMVAKGRSATGDRNGMRTHPERRRGGGPPGTGNGHAKLTEDQVRALRARAIDGERVIDLASEFGLNRTHLSEILSKKWWRHVT